MATNKLIQKRNIYYVTYNVQSQILTTIPGQLDPVSPIIDENLYFLLNGENGTGNATVTGTPANQVPYPGFGGSRIIYSGIDSSIYNNQIINSFVRGFHPGSAFKNISSPQNSRNGTRYWFSPPFPSNANVVYIPKFKSTLDNFIAGCSIRLSKPPKARINALPYSVSLLGTSWTPSTSGWYTYFTIEEQVDPTPAYLLSPQSGNTIDRDVKNKLNLVFYFVYNNNIVTSHTLYNFTYDTWVDLVWSYNQNVVLLSINNNIKSYYSMPIMNPVIGGTFDLVLGSFLPDTYRFMGSIDNLYLKKYI